MPANSSQRAPNDDGRPPAEVGHSPAATTHLDPTPARLAAFTEAISRPQTVSELIVTAADELHDLTGAGRVDVWLFERHSARFVPTHSTDGTPPPLDSADQAVQEAWKSRQPVASVKTASGWRLTRKVTQKSSESQTTPTTKSETQTAASPSNAADARPVSKKAQLLIPLFSGHRRTGMIRLSPDPGFSPAVGRLLTSQLHLAMASTTQLDQLIADHHASRIAEGRLQRLYQVLDRFKELRSSSAITTRIPEQACEMLGYSYAFVYGKPNGTWQAEGSCADRARLPQGAVWQIHVSAKALDEIVEHHQTIAIRRPAGDPRLVSRFAHEHFARCALVPLYGAAQPKVLVAAHHSPGKEIEDSDLELLSLYGRISDNALRNIRLLERLQLEREQAASVVEGTADGIVTLDHNGTIELFNPAMEALTGYRASEVLGRSAQDLFEPHTDEDKPCSLTMSGDGTDGIQRTISIATKSFGRRWVGLTSAPVIDERLVLVMRDVTEQYEFWQRQSEFVSIASHELRTPITALIGFLSLAKTAAKEEERGHFTNRAHAAAARLSELVEDLLSVARIEEGRLQVHLETVAPNEAMQEIIDNLQHLAAQKDVILRYRTPAGRSLAIRADRSKLMQVYANLVDNAIKYTPPGGRVTVKISRRKDQVITEIADTGIGIDQSNLDRVFDKFFREYTELSVSAGGTGLGLFITKELVDRQGGHLTIRSAKQKGTTATLTFPATESV